MEAFSVWFSLLPVCIIWVNVSGGTEFVVFQYLIKIKIWKKITSILFYTLYFLEYKNQTFFKKKNLRLNPPWFPALHATSRNGEECWQTCELILFRFSYCSWCLRTAAATNCSRSRKISTSNVATPSADLTKIGCPGTAGLRKAGFALKLLCLNRKVTASFGHVPYIQFCDIRWGTVRKGAQFNVHRC